MHVFHVTVVEVTPVKCVLGQALFWPLLASAAGVRVVIKPIPLSRYPLARKGILFGGRAMEKGLDTRRR